MDIVVSTNSTRVDMTVLLAFEEKHKLGVVVMVVGVCCEVFICALCDMSWKPIQISVCCPRLGCS